ncbi:hypothetical protein EYF80_028595 [Liparis tanakae]|uniref:Uncharacterized protein n=1 Tax=Liparis tanakae TaxID=230148 RepID=A0A4Z2H6S5_9TELE|nr:hypothetical protein EYF80_028595 [Liparis tanakae]
MDSSLRGPPYCTPCREPQMRWDSAQQQLGRTHISLVLLDIRRDKVMTKTRVYRRQDPDLERLRPSQERDQGESKTRQDQHVEGCAQVKTEAGRDRVKTTIIRA